MPIVTRLLLAVNIVLWLYVLSLSRTPGAAEAFYDRYSFDWAAFSTAIAGGSFTGKYPLTVTHAKYANGDYCLTLNEAIPEEHVLGRFSYEHPLYTVATLRAQSQLPRLAGGRTHFAGAYFGNGFHEDGLASGVAVARALGVDW
jgi:predicted NAD/FAD-binding protein